MSGTEIAYHLRVNKHIDRHLFIEALRRADRYFDIAEYGYVSMAGAYLEDCRVLHQSMRISRMFSFDGSGAVVARQLINRPFDFITCIEAMSRDVVDDFDNCRAAAWGQDANVVVWLDYTSPAGRHDQLQELGALVPKMIAGDIVRITLNANRNSLGEQVHFNRITEAEREETPTLAAWRHGKLKSQIGAYLPPDRDDPSHMESKIGLCKTLIRAIKQVAIGAIVERPELLIFPLLSTAYSDQHQMVTVTFAIVEADDFNEFSEYLDWNSWLYRPGENWDDCVEIEVPHLSLRERHILHQLIQHGGAFGGTRPNFIGEDAFAQYQSHYRRYPTFASFDI